MVGSFINRKSSERQYSTRPTRRPRGSNRDAGRLNGFPFRTWVSMTCVTQFFFFNFWHFKRKELKLMDESVNEKFQKKKKKDMWKHNGSFFLPNGHARRSDKNKFTSRITFARSAVFIFLLGSLNGLTLTWKNVKR
jgi:hypothetical protein